MHSPAAPTILLALALAGCADPAPTRPAPASATFARSGSAAASAATRPISGRCELTIGPLPSAPPIIRQTDTGTCQLSHLGRTSFEGVLEVNLATGAQRGERTLTAANGDVLRVVSVGTSAPSGPGLVSFVFVATFTGGTGRFANATGQARGEGTANLATRTTVLTLDGWIAYDASDRN
jgi:hypothetical protein